MDNQDIYMGFTDFKMMQLYAEIKMEMTAMMTKLDRIRIQASDRKGEELLDCNQVMNILKIKRDRFWKPVRSVDCQ